MGQKCGLRKKRDNRKKKGGGHLTEKISYLRVRLENETIMVAPAAGFYSTEGLGKNQVRIAYVLNKEDLRTSVAILKAALTQYKD